VDIPGKRFAFCNTAPVMPLAFCTAIALYLPPGPASRMSATALSALMSALGFMLARKAGGSIGAGRRAPLPGMARWLAAAGLGLCLGAVLHARVESQSERWSQGFAETASGRIVACEGRLASDPRRTSGGMLALELELRATLGNDGARMTAAGRLAVYARPGRGKAPVRGQDLRVTLPRASPLSPDPPSRTGAGAWTNALATRMAFVDPSGIETLGEPSRLESLRAKSREALLDALGKAGGKAGPLLEALIVGVRDDLDADLADAFRKAGCVHILALSGQHVGILASLVALALGFALGPFRARFVACVLAGVYLFIVGASPSVLRSVAMFWISSAAIATDRPQKPLAILAIAFVLIAAWRPASAHSLSFQLSYLAMAGLAVVAPVCEFTLRRWLPPPVSGAIAAGLGALAMTAPLSALVFGTLNPISPVASALAGPLVAALMYAGIGGAALASIVPALAPVAAAACGIPHFLLGALMGAFADLPSIMVAEPGGRMLLTALVALAACIVYAWPYASHLAESRRRPASGQLRLTFRALSPPRAPRPRHEEKIRPEFPRQRQHPQARRRPLRGGNRIAGLGDRPGDGLDDLRGAAGGPGGIGLRDRQGLR
jgi:ComEC/Rec2-related protein